MQHGESFTFFLDKARKKYLAGHTYGGEPLVTVSPFGEQTPTAAFFVDNLSIMNGRPYLEEGKIMEIRRPDITGEYVALAGAEVNSMIDLNFVSQFSGQAQRPRRKPENHEKTRPILQTTIDQFHPMLSVSDMATLLDKASEAAFSLPRKERAALVHALIQSLDEVIDEGVEAAWQEEINRRLNAVEAGQTSERDAFVALDEIEARLRETG